MTPNQMIDWQAVNERLMANGAVRCHCGGMVLSAGGDYTESTCGQFCVCKRCRMFWPLLIVLMARQHEKNTSLRNVIPHPRLPNLVLK